MGIVRLTPQLVATTGARTRSRAAAQELAMRSLAVAKILDMGRAGRPGLEGLRRGLGVLVNTGGGVLVEMTDAQAAAAWANPGPNAYAYVNPTTGVYTGYGYNGPTGSRAPQPTPGFDDMGSAGNPIFPSSAAPSLASYMSHVLEQAQNVCMGNSASSSCRLSSGDAAQIAAQFCVNAPASPGCGAPAAVVTQFSTDLAAYQARLSAYFANPSAATGDPVYGNGSNIRPALPAGTVPVTIPGMQTIPSGGGASTAFPVPPIPNRSTDTLGTDRRSTGGGGSTATGNGSTGGGTVATNARIENLTRPGQSNFMVGDKWRITITGAPGQSVYGLATQDGTTYGPAQNYGKTDSSGQLVLTGQMDAATVGVWSEKWAVGDGTAATIAFSVVSASSQPGGGSGSTGGGNTTNTGHEDTGGGNPFAGAGSGFDLNNLPWGLIAAGVAGLAFLMGGRR